MANSARIIEATDNDISLLARFVRASTNHAPTGEIQKKMAQCPNACPHDLATHTRTHILTEYTFSSIQELLAHDDSLTVLINFLKNNNGAFSFEDAPYKPP